MDLLLCEKLRTFAFPYGSLFTITMPIAKETFPNMSIVRMISWMVLVMTQIPTGRK